MNDGVDDTLKDFPFGRIGEDDFGHHPPIQMPVFLKDRAAKLLNDARQAFGPRFDGFTRQTVGIDNRKA